MRVNQDLPQGHLNALRQNSVDIDNHDPLSGVYSEHRFKKGKLHHPSNC